MQSASTAPSWPASADVRSEDRRERKRAKKVDQILQTTAAVIAEKGYHGMALEDVAERLDLAKASLYHYFPGKEELAFACLKTCADFVSRSLREVAAEPGRPIERLRRLISTQLTLTTRDYPEMSYLFLHPLDWPQEIRLELRHWRDEHNAIFADVIREAVEVGEIQPLDERISRRCLYGALNHAPLWLPRAGASLDDSIDCVTDTVMRLFTLAEDTAPRPARTSA